VLVPFMKYQCGRRHQIEHAPHDIAREPRRRHLTGFWKPPFVLGPQTVDHERKGTCPTLLTTDAARSNLTEGWRPRQRQDIVEPISKLSEQDNEAGELDKAEEVLSVEFPADEYAALPLYPGKETLDEPASHIAA
jgi:hypothetical protein